jgi:hypothetical protein
MSFYLFAKRQSLILLILSCLFLYLAAHIQYNKWSIVLVLGATRTIWCFTYFKSVQIWSYISMYRNHGCEIMGYVYFDI